MTNLLLLDIDDVLNSDEYFTKNEDLLDGETPDESPRLFLDPEAVDRVNRILDRAEPTPDVILSSSWRHTVPPDEMTGILQDRGATFEVQEKIPGRRRRPVGLYSHGYRKSVPHDRGVYIDRFLKHHHKGSITGLVVLDNLPLEELKPVEEFVVQTQPENGLLDNHVNEAIEILDQPVPSELIDE